MLFKRHKIYWYRFTIKGRRIRESTNTTNKSLALQIEADRRYRMLLMPIQQVGRFDKILQNAFLPWSEVQNKPRTHQRYQCSAKPLAEFFGSLKFDRLANADIEGFKLWRLKQCSPAGVNRDLAALRFILNWAVRNSYLMRSPFNCKLLPEGPGNRRIVSPEEEELYLQNANPLLRDIATLIVETGIRPGEVFAIRRDHVKDEYLLIPDGKTHFARRTIPLSSRALKVLSGRGGDHLFRHKNKEAPMVCLRSHRTLCRKLKLDFRLYDFRHTFGTRATMAGVDLATLKELMGHSDISTTMRYVHPTPEHKKNAIRKLEKWHKTGTNQK